MDPLDYGRGSPDLIQALDMIEHGIFSPDQPALFRPIVESLTTGDRFFVMADSASYLAAQAQIEALYPDRDEWSRRAILNVARMGPFSSDRAVRDYARTVWETVPLGQERSEAATSAN
jgi:starch phosphorylase